MFPFVISFLFSVLQTFLLKSLMGAITAGKRAKFLGFFLLKFVLYGVGIALFIFKYIGYAVFCFAGFAAGMPLTAFAIFIYYSFIKKE